MAPSHTKQAAHVLTRYVSEGEVAKCLRVDPKTIYRMRKSGLLPYLKLGHRIVLFDPVAVAEALEKFTVNARTGTAKAQNAA